MMRTVKFSIVILTLGVVLFLLSNSKTRYTVIDTRSGVKISSFDPVSKKGFEMRLPDNLEIPGADGRGKWNAAKIGRAGEPSWAAESVAGYLGVTFTKANGYIWWWDRLRVKWEKIDMAKKGWMQETRAVDGEPVTHLTESWKVAAKEMFVSEIISQQRWNVEVVNSSGEVGWGSKTADRIESIGVRVSEVKTGQEQEEGCWVEGQRKNKREAIVKIMLANWGCKWRENSQMGERELLLLLGLAFGSGQR